MASSGIDYHVSPPIQTAVPSVVKAPRVLGTDIAVVGIAGRFPGASNPDDFYQLLLDRKEAMAFLPDMPAESIIFPGGKYVPTRGALLEIDHFDSGRWGIKEEEALCVCFLFSESRF